MAWLACCMLRHAPYCPLSSINTTECWRSAAAEALEAKRRSNDRCAPTLGNVRNCHFLRLFICLSEPILSRTFCLVKVFICSLFRIKPSFSSRLKSTIIKTSFFILSLLLFSLSPSLLSLSAALPIPLPLICVLSLPQSQIIPSLWN